MTRRIRSTAVVAAAILPALAGCGDDGVRIVRFPFLSPTIFYDSNDNLSYGVAVQNYGNATSSPTIQMVVTTSFTSSQGGSCNQGMNMGWFAIGALAPEAKWSSYGKSLASLTYYPQNCACMKGSCSGSVTFRLATDTPYGGGKFIPDEEITIQFSNTGQILARAPAVKESRALALAR